MSSNDLISVIVPIYNVEKYLEKCVKSIINQKYKNLEIILINDGSTDKSGELAEKLEKTDNRIKVYHKENGGLSDARNYGVNKATGNYIGFVDSDDYIHEDMYKHLYEVIIKENADIAECNFTFVYNDDNEQLHYDKEYYLVLDKKEYLKEYLSMEKLYGATCCRLINIDIAKKIYFPVGKLYEDTYYSLDLIKTANKYVIINNPYYYYLIRESSITNENFNDRQLDIIEIANKLKDYTYNTYSDLKNEADNRVMYANFSIFNKIILLDNFKENKNYNEILQYFKKNKVKILKNPVISKNRKLSVLLLTINVNLYKKVLKKYMKGLATK